MSQTSRTFLAGFLSAGVSVLLCFILIVWAKAGPQKEPGLGAAPAFSLTAQDGRSFDFAETRGSVVALSFVFTRCTDICPIATFKLAWIQDELGEAFGREALFVTVTIDPENDTVETLAEYADLLGANLQGWTFLTGDNSQIKQVAESYGVYTRPADGAVEHILLTSLIDRDGVIRTQYLGERFDPEEMLTDIWNLIDKTETG